MEMRPILSAMRRNKFGALAHRHPDGGHPGVSRQCPDAGRAAHRLERPAFRPRRGRYLRHAKRDWSIIPAILPRVRQRTSMRCVRCPGVVDAYTTNMYPLEGGGWVETVNLTADQKTPTAFAAHYMGDEHALNTMGLKLIAGRNFSADEIANRIGQRYTAAERLHHDEDIGCRSSSRNGDALGQAIFVENQQARTHHRHRRSPARPHDRCHRVVTAPLPRIRS